MHRKIIQFTIQNLNVAIFYYEKMNVQYEYKLSIFQIATNWLRRYVCTRLAIQSW